MIGFVARTMIVQPFTVHFFTGLGGDGGKTYNAPIELSGYQTSGAFPRKPTLAEEGKLAEHIIFVDAPDVTKINSGSRIVPINSEDNVEYLVTKITPYFKEQGVLDYGMVYLK